jgi:dTDP-4-dehydrorhamnose reductase
MGIRVAEAFGLDPGLCRKVPYSPEPNVAQRGKNLCLSSQKAEAEFDLRLMRFEDGLREMWETEPLLSQVTDH